MHKTIICTTFSLLLSCFLVGCATEPTSSGTQSSRDKMQQQSVTKVSQADSRLNEIIENDWQMVMTFFPTYASRLGMGNAELDSRWTDQSLDAINKRNNYTLSVLESLETIEWSKLSPQNKVNYDLFKWELETRVRAFELDQHLLPISQRGGVQTLDNTTSYLSLLTVADYQNWLARLKAIPEVLAQTRALMERGMQKSMMPPKATMNRLPAQLQSQIVNTPKDSRFFKVFDELPEHFSQDQKAALRQAALSTIEEKIIPAYRHFKQFFEQEYLPACRETVGLYALPNGKAFYQNLIKKFTTTDMTPEQIHQLGLEEVAKNRAQMQKIIEEVNFEGSFDEFIHFLRTAPQFYYDTPEELFNAYLATSKRLDPELTKLFGKLPRAPYGLKAIPDNIAPDTTTAYYSSPSADGLRAGYYYVNLHQPHTRPKYEMEVLSVHEAVPGHHLQIALQMELQGLPNFRRYGGFTVFVEGWGLYSERLGYDMGLYQDPYSRFGQLTYDMWRSVRLVVDTGMHHMGWSRQQAIDYFKANAAKSVEDIINEIDRYISNPGQALAYKIGQLKILELRERATKKLGDKFDIRAFHDVVLGSGSVPLNVLEKNVEQWIKEQH